jgi:prepilin-type N-terminal cleavage/methylation domain-containing protein
MPSIRQTRGFTLVEVAIVVMIAGLLVGGVLRGQELVQQARAKSLVNDFSGVAAAVLAYRDRYNAWPGDDSGAGTRWTSAGLGTVVAGNGDGVIGGSYNDVPTPAQANDPTTITVGAGGTGESLLAWWHMRLAGFVFGPLNGPGAANLPLTAAGGILGLQNGTTVAGMFPGIMACANDLSDKIALTVDAQIDDMVPTTGQVRTRRQAAAGAPPPALTATTAFNDYVEDGSFYVVCRQLN